MNLTFTKLAIMDTNHSLVPVEREERRESTNGTAIENDHSSFVVLNESYVQVLVNLL